MSEYSPTWINDEFPMDQLECQYYDICNAYLPNDCPYNSPCAVRQKLKSMLEDYVAAENIKLQVGLILDEQDN